jgi:hypothetical protein
MVESPLSELACLLQIRVFKVGAQRSFDRVLVRILGHFLARRIQPRVSRASSRPDVVVRVLHLATVSFMDLAFRPPPSGVGRLLPTLCCHW